VNLLVCNCGSSSLGWKLFRVEGGNLEVLARGKAHRLGVNGTADPVLEFFLGEELARVSLPLPDHRSAVREVLGHLRESGLEFQAVGHRIVHGGKYFLAPALVDDSVLDKLRLCRSAAPLHTPFSLEAIEEIARIRPELPQFLAFDTAFHAGLLPEAAAYALPPEAAEPLGLRKYGFHGLSCEYVSGEAARFLSRPLASLRLVICHLGTGGSSVSAVAAGRSLDTSMGYSPLAGLIMSTRCGDLDPEAVLALVRRMGDPEKVSELLNERSGLLGLSGFSPDLRDILARRGEDPRGELAFAAYVHRLRLYVGGYAAVLGGLDALVFTDDVGVQVPEVREEACRGLGFMGVRIDGEANRRISGGEAATISIPASPVSVLVVPTDEEVVIARQGLSLLTKKNSEGRL